MRHGKNKTKLLPRAFYDREPDVVARELLGKLLIRQHPNGPLVGRVIETEAYLGDRDPASHAYRGKSPFNAVLFGPPGYTDIYLIYGLHYCMNVSCLPDGQPGGVLFRAILPLEGISEMARLRDVPATSSAKLLAGGPGKLCQALDITRTNGHGLDVTTSSSPITLAEDGFQPTEVLVTKRIGITKAMDLPLRFVLKPT